MGLSPVARPHARAVVMRYCETLVVQLPLTQVVVSMRQTLFTQLRRVDVVLFSRTEVKPVIGRDGGCVTIGVGVGRVGVTRVGMMFGGPPRKIIESLRWRGGGGRSAVIIA